MKQMADLQFAFPAYMQREVAQQRNRMNRIAQLTINALDEESEIYSYAVYKTLSTVGTMAFLKKASISYRKNSELQAWIEQCINSYLAEMEKIPQEACEKILQVLQDVTPDTVSDVGLLEEVMAVFSRRLTG